MNSRRTNSCKIREEIRMMQTVKAGENNTRERLENLSFFSTRDQNIHNIRDPRHVVPM